MVHGSLVECKRYTFNRRILVHLSCPDCACTLFVEEPHNVLAINVRCLDDISQKLEQLTLRKFDGRNVL